MKNGLKMIAVAGRPVNGGLAKAGGGRHARCSATLFILHSIEGRAMIDQIRRTILTTGAAATAMAAAPAGFAQQATQSPASFSYFERGNVRIRYQEAGSGFPLLVTPGGRPEFAD